MRVISGKARGLRLDAPEGLTTRPTLDRIKESLFNILSQDLFEIDFLDLFSGSGAIGIEAISRGATSAVFVDENQNSIDVITKNLAFTRLTDQATVIKSDVVSAINRLKREGKTFDIIFMDPPYNKGLIQLTINSIYKAKLLKPDGFIVAEQSIEDELPNVEGFEVYRVKEYKITKMTFLRYVEANNS